MIRADDLLGEASGLLTESMTEARRRTVMGRAYYAAYHHVFEHPAIADIANEIEELRECNRKVGKAPPGAHSLLVRKLRGTRDRTLCRAGDILSRLLNARIKADYHLGAVVTDVEAPESVALAKRLFNDVLPLPPSL